MSAVLKDVGLQPSLLGDVCVGKSDDSQSEQNTTSYMKSSLHLLTAVFQVMFYNQGQEHLWLESVNF